MSATRADILEVKENAAGGHDYVIGDIHGNLARLKRVLARLGPNDRLFCVGDLVDKGPESFAVIQLLMDPQYKDKVFVIRGNHEQMWLDAIKSLEFFTMFFSRLYPEKMMSKLKQVIAQVAGSKGERGKLKVAESLLGRPFVRDQATDERVLKAVDDLYLHLINVRPPGVSPNSWVVDQYLKDLTANGIQVVTSQDTETKEKHSRIHYVKDDIYRVRSYLANLPVVLVKSGKKPFVLSHADIPITDKELLERLAQKKLKLPEGKVRYAIWARYLDAEVPFIEIRDANSIPGAVGHSPTILEGTVAVRKGSNIINDDVGAFYIDNFLLLDMTTGTAEYIEPTDDPLLLRIRDEINQHLQAQMQRGLVLQAVPLEGGGEQLVLISDPEAVKEFEGKAGEQKRPQSLQLDDLDTLKPAYEAPERDTSEAGSKQAVLLSGAVEEVKSPAKGQGKLFEKLLAKRPPSGEPEVEPGGQPGKKIKSNGPG